MTLACPRCASPISDRVKLARHAVILHDLSVAEAVVLVREAAETLRRAKLRAITKALWANPEQRRRYLESHTPEYRENLSRKSLAAWRRPDSRARMLAANQRTGQSRLARQHRITAMTAPTSLVKVVAIARWADPAVRARHKARMNQPETLAKIRENARRRRDDPVFLANLKAGCNRPESKERMRASIKALWATPEGWKRMMGRRRHNGAAPTGREA